MNTTEQQMRNGLRELAAAAEFTVELDAVVREGRRIRRSRWIRGTSVAVSVAAIGLLGWPLATGTPIPAVPIPARTPATAPPTPIRATAELPFAIADPGDLAFARVEIAAARTGLDTSVDVVAEAVGGDRVEQHYDVSGTGFWHATVAPGLELALIPGRVERVIALGGVGQAVDRQSLNGMDATVVAIQPGTAGREFAGLLWLDDDGVLHNSLGEVVPSADLPYTLVEPDGPPSPRQVVMFRDESLDVWGYLDSNSDDGVTHPLSSEPIDTMARVSATVEGDYSFTSIAVGFLPSGGSDPELTLLVANAEWTSAEVGDTGRIALLAVAERIRRDQPLVESIAYTDRDGVRTSYTPS